MSVNCLYGYLIVYPFQVCGVATGYRHSYRLSYYSINSYSSLKVGLATQESAIKAKEKRKK